jgi:hypothetical protein
MKSSVIIGGKSPKNNRNAADFYATPPECTIALLNRFEWLFRGRRIWEPACGDGAISKVLELRGFRVVSSDLYDRGYGESNMNFLNAECACDAIITNPPFRLASNFIERSAEKKVPFAMLTKSTFWHAEKRRRLFMDTGPMAVMAMTWRPAMSPERGKSATMDFIWTVWSSKPNKETKYIVERRP